MFLKCVIFLIKDCDDLCYRNLAQEISEGQDKYQRTVIDGKAIQKELSQIGEYLGKFRI